MKEYQEPTMENLTLEDVDVIMASMQPQTLRYFGVGDVEQWDESWN